MTKKRGMVRSNTMKKLENLLNEARQFIPGNDNQLRLSLMAILLKGNVLIEDVPGMGKTTLVKYLARSTGLEFKRIQFTNDLLPSDITGVSIYQKESETFLFKPGPIFGELILADEINRGTSKTQSALLEAMEENRVTVDGKTYPLPANFSLFATQNPRGQLGTYPLPESQLDRFLFKFPMGHLSRAEEIELLLSGARDDNLESVVPLISKEELTSISHEIKKIKTSNTLLEYLVDILQTSRKSAGVFGLSPRAGLDLIDAAKAWAYFEKRDFVIPDDIQEVFPYVAGHRMYFASSLLSSEEVLRARDFIKTISFVKDR